jgi:site-specific DNA-adenine methylase
MKPIFPFYGSKWRDAKRYPAPQPSLRTGRTAVVEPFAGSAGYSLWHAPDKVLLIDADPIIVGVWEYLIAVTAEEILALPDLEPGQSTDDLALPQEARWLIGFWLNRGSASPKKTQTAFSRRTERAQLVWSERARQRIVGELDGIRHWKVRLGSYEDCPTPTGGVTYFVDPPYVDKGRYYRINHVDHDAIGRWACTLPATAPDQTIVCEQEGADWLPFETLATIKSTKGTSAEVVWRGE